MAFLGDQAYGRSNFNTPIAPYAPQGGAGTTGSLAAPSAPSSGVSDGLAYGGLALGGLLSGDWTGALQGAGGYYGSEQAIEAARAAGETGFNLSEQQGTRALENSTFRPYTVTSNLSQVGTDERGGFNVNLSPEQQAMQNQAFGQASSLFGQVGVDPRIAQEQLYNQMRDIQRPDEERNRLALEERMLSQGRLGLSSNAYGGSSPELLAQETAIQEAMARSNLAARTQSLSERDQAATLGGQLQGFGYKPQNQALGLLEASQVPAGFANQGQRLGAELQQRAGSNAVESFMQGSSLANELSQQQMQNLINSAVGSAPTIEQQLMNRYLNPEGDALQNAGGFLTDGISSAIDWGKGLFSGSDDYQYDYQYDDAAHVDDFA